MRITTFMTARLLKDIQMPAFKHEDFYQIHTQKTSVANNLKYFYISKSIM